MIGIELALSYILEYGHADRKDLDTGQVGGTAIRDLAIAFRNSLESTGERNPGSKVAADIHGSCPISWRIMAVADERTASNGDGFGEIIGI